MERAKIIHRFAFMVNGTTGFFDTPRNSIYHLDGNRFYFPKATGRTRKYSRYVSGVASARISMRYLNALPQLASIFALIVWGLTFPLLNTLGKRLSEPPTLALVIGIGLASLLNLIARNPHLRPANLMLWLSGGVWTGAAYQNPQVLGLAYLLVALLTLGSAVVREREHDKFSLSGPAVFVAAVLVTTGVSNALAG